MPDNQPMDGVFRESVRLFQRHAGLVAVAVAIGFVLGLTVGLTRPTSYSAESKLVVGTFDAPADAIPGYVLAAQTVAQDYARLASSPQITDPLSEQLGMSPTEIGEKIQVTAIPSSAVLRVTATAGEQDRAVEMSEAMATTIQQAVTALNSPEANEALLDEHEQAARELAAAKAKVASAQAAQAQAVAASSAGSQAAADATAALDEARLAEQTATLREQGLADQYRVSQQQSSSSGQVRGLGGAVVREGSRLTTTLVGAVVGIAMGLGVGLLLALRRDRMVAGSFEPEWYLADQDGHDEVGDVAAGADADDGPDGVAQQAEAVP